MNLIKRLLLKLLLFSILNSAVFTQDKPVFLYIFCHTEDHINLDLSSERFYRLLPVMKQIKQSCETNFPGWTFSVSYQFYGADARVFADSIPALIDTILTYRDQGVIETGYHGAHEPTHVENFFNELIPDPSWHELSEAARKHFSWYRALYSFYPVDSTQAGGLSAYQRVFGDPIVVSGLNPYEFNHVTHHSAILHRLAAFSQTQATFGFDEHGPVLGSPAYFDGVDSLMTILCPTPDHPRELFYMGHLLRISGTDGITRNCALRDDQNDIQNALNGLDRSHAHCMGFQTGMKYIYTRPGYSPTNYAYNHPQNPKLLQQGLLPDSEKEQNYAQTEANLHYLVNTFLQQNPNSHFVSNRDLLDMFPSANFTAVDQKDIQSAVEDLLEHWEDRPPPYVQSSGLYFSLSDIFLLLVKSLGGYQHTGALPAQVFLSCMWGPFNIRPPFSSPVPVSMDSILTRCHQWSPDAGDTTYSIVPVNIIPDTIRLSGSLSINPAEFLNLMSKTYLKITQNSHSAVSLQPSIDAPVTYDIYQRNIGDMNVDLIWTMKPVILSQNGTSVYNSNDQSSVRIKKPDLCQCFPNPFNTSV